MNPPTRLSQPPGPACYTAARLALALGMSKRGILYALRDVAPSQTLIVSGNPADAWPFCALPASLQQRLEAEAARQRCRNPEQLLALGEKAWEPDTPLSKLPQSCLDQAAKLQRALAPALARQADQKLSEAEFERLGLEDYRKVFGFEISPRHWRRLFRRTVERDSGAENFDRLELYLDERPRGETRAPSAEAHAANAELSSVIATFKDPTAPTAEEVAYLWTRAFEQFEADTAEGKPTKKAKGLLIDFLASAAPFLAVSRAGLRMQFERKYERWTEGGRLPRAVLDKRPEKSGRFRAPALSQADRDTLVGKAVLFHGSRLAPAWRELCETGELDSKVAGHYLSNPSRKSYVPRAIREEVQPEIERLFDIHHGPRQAKLNGAHLSRDWSGVAAGDWYQADDCTFPIYYYEPNEEGWYTLWRGQCLVMTDLRSGRILGYALLSSRNYNSLAIRTLITRVADEHGLPRGGFYFERGIWKSSKILTGEASKAPLSYAEVEGGLRDLGLRFKHATLPRGKPVEGILGAVQNLMEGEPGYVGRDEKNDRYERVQKDKLLVESKKLNPQGRFHSAESWLARLDEIFEQYNRTPQEGKMTGGLSPDDAFWKYQNSADPQIKLDASSRYLLAHHRRPVRVTANGITLRFGKNVYTYRNERTGALIGETVYAWFNPEIPDVLCVTDDKRRNPFTVERAADVPAIDAPEDLLKDEMDRIAAHHKHAKAYYHTLRAKFAPQFRRNLVAAESAELGTEIRQQTDAALAKRAEEGARNQRIERAARKLNMIVPPSVARRAGADEAVQRLGELMSRPTEPQAEQPAKTPAPQHKVYQLKPFGSEKRQYVDYLVHRLTTFRQSGKSFGQQFGGAVTDAVTVKIAQAHLGGALYDEAQFDRVVAYLREKIDATVLGKRNLASGQPNYHEFETA